MGRRLEAAALALAFLCVVLLTIMGTMARDWLGTASSEHGAGIDGMIRYLLVATAIIFIAGHVVLALFVWRYGRKDTADAPTISRKLERRWSIVPVIIMTGISEIGVLTIGLPVWGKIYEEPPADAVRVEVTGRQFEWVVRYPGKDGVFGRTDLNLVDGVDNPAGLDETDPAAIDDLVFINQIRLPVDRTILVQLRSRDVIHSFAVPDFRVKQDLIPGMELSTKFKPVKTGKFELMCAELCGLGHYQMRGVISVLNGDDYSKWLAAERGWFE